MENAQSIDTPPSKGRAAIMLLAILRDVDGDGRYLDQRVGGGPFRWRAKHSR